MYLTDNVIGRREMILDKRVLPGLEMQGGDGKGSFAAMGHLHTYTRAFGDPETREGIWLLNHAVSAQFTLDETWRGHQHVMKFVAMLETWQNRAADLEFGLNGQVLRTGKMLFENVVSGWPANFLDLPGEHLRDGVNTVMVRNRDQHSGRQAVFINKIEILVKPADAAFQFELAPRVIRVGEPFFIRIRNTTGAAITVATEGAWRQVAHRREGWEDIFEFVTDRLNNRQSLTFHAGAAALVYRPQRVAWAGAPYHHRIGMDLNDDRHDETTPGIIEFFHKTEMGNAIGFRPHVGRNCYRRPNREELEAWFQQLQAARMYFWMENGAFNQPAFREAAPERFAPALAATKYHEFCHGLGEFASELQNLQAGTDLFFAQVKAQREMRGYPDTPFWVADASMKLCLLAASEHCDLPIAEPVTFDHMVIYNAIKRSARIHGKNWGAHVAVQWFLGQGNTADKLRRLRATMHLALISGAQVIYSESGVFKYVQYSMQRDSDHPFTRAARDILRELYAFSRVQEVTGELVSDVNVLYGNLESAFFYPDHVPLDTNKSDGLRRLWYRWERTAEDFGWMALKNLCRPLRQAGLKGYPGDQGENYWFSANPYGGVDIISVHDLPKSPQKVSLMLGRNSMTAAVHATLLAYVQAGGILFLTAQQFNTELDPDQPTRFFREGDFTELCGVRLTGGTQPFQVLATTAGAGLAWPRAEYRPVQGDEVMQVLKAQVPEVEILARDAQSGAPVVVTRPVGCGRVYFYLGATPIGHSAMQPFVNDLVSGVAALAQPDCVIVNEAEVFLQAWRATAKGSTVTKLFLLNFNWTAELPAETAELAVGGKRMTLEVPLGPPVVLYRTAQACFGAVSPWTQIWDIEATDHTLRFRALGRDLESFRCLPLHGPLTRVTCDGQVIALAANCGGEGVVAFAADLNTAREFSLEFAAQQMPEGA